MAIIRRLPELGQIIYRDRGRIPVLPLAIVTLIGLPLGFGVYWLLTRKLWAAQGWFHALPFAVTAGALIFAFTITPVLTARALVVCEHGLVRYIRFLGTSYGAFLVIDLPELLARSVAYTDDLAKLRRTYVESVQPDGSSINEGSTGQGIAFLARNRDTAKALRGESLTLHEKYRLSDGEAIGHAHAAGQPLDPKTGIVCWTHPTRAHPAEVAQAILYALARNGDKDATARLNTQLTVLDPIWQAFRR